MFPYSAKTSQTRLNSGSGGEIILEYLSGPSSQPQVTSSERGRGRLGPGREEGNVPASSSCLKLGEASDGLSPKPEEGTPPCNTLVSAQVTQTPDLEPPDRESTFLLFSATEFVAVHYRW